MKDKICDIVSKIHTNKYQKVLIIDKSTSFDMGILDDLKKCFVDVGYTAHICNTEDASVDHVKFTSIVARMQHKVECSIFFADSCSKPLTIPKPFVVSKNRVFVFVFHTRFKKQPYAKKMFDNVFTLHEESENQHVAMAKSLVKNSLFHEVFDIDIHDLNMLMLIFHQNVLKMKLDITDLMKLYDILIASEVFINNDDGSFSPSLQVATFIHMFRKKSPLRTMEFTQHLSKYSQQSANKKKVIDKYDDIKHHMYDKLLMEDSPIIQELCASFNSCLVAYS